MTARRILSFLAVLVALVGMAAPPASADATKGFQFSVNNTLPKEMVFDLTFQNPMDGQQVTERYTVPPRQTVHFGNECTRGLCLDAALGIIDEYEDTSCRAHLRESGGTVVVTLTEMRSPPTYVVFFCAFTGNGIRSVDMTTGLYYR